MERHHTRDNPWYAWQGPRPAPPTKKRVRRRERRKGRYTWALWFDGLGAHFTWRIDGIIQWEMW